MNTPGIFSVAAGGLAVVLGLWLMVAGFSGTSLQAKLLELQEEAQARSGVVQKQQRVLQQQQQEIESGAQLAQQVGPAVLRDLAAVQVETRNPRIEELLKKYGLEIRKNEETNP